MWGLDLGIEQIISLDQYKNNRRWTIILFLLFLNVFCIMGHFMLNQPNSRNFPGSNLLSIYFY